MTETGTPRSFFSPSRRPSSLVEGEIGENPGTPHYAADAPRTQDPGPRTVIAPWIRLLLAIAVALAVFPATASAETRPHYELEMEVAWADGTVEVAQKTTFRNNTGADLNELVFQVVPAYFDAFGLASAQVDGREVAATREGTVLVLALDAPVTRDATVQVELGYRLAVPELGGRFGRGNGTMALGNFFPVLAPYRDGWDRHQYVDVGDAFFTEVADFGVVLAADAPLKVAASAPGAREGNVWRYRAESLRDFAITLSDRYQVGSREVDGIHLTAYATSAARLDAYLAAAARALRWYSASFGSYPYPSLAVAEIYADDMGPTAMEYPGLIMAYGALGSDGGGAGSYSEYVVAHEVGHQWFYSLVGNDEVHDPWLDEALATYTDMLFLRDHAPWAFRSYWQRNLAAYRNRAAYGGDRLVNTTVYDYPSDGPYFDIVYRKGAAFLDELRTLMGDDDFFGLLRDYVGTYSHKVAVPRAFLDMAYERIGPGLPPLVAEYFGYGAFVDGSGYSLEVQWPEALSPEGQAELFFGSDFAVSEARVWLDGRLLYSGAASSYVPLSLGGVEEGEYILRLDLLDDQGALYQKAKRVVVK